MEESETALLSLSPSITTGPQCTEIQVHRSTVHSSIHSANNLLTSSESGWECKALQRKATTNGNGQKGRGGKELSGHENHNSYGGPNKVLLIRTELQGTRSWGKPMTVKGTMKGKVTEKPRNMQFLRTFISKRGIVMNKELWKLLIS
jgi:hypothetical protein